jgi:hypothetical protein
MGGVGLCTSHNDRGDFSGISADLADAHRKARGCPLLAHGGSVEVAPTLDT